MKLTMGEIAAMLETSSPSPERTALGYSIDSRTLVAGQLFFAIRGPRFDGHSFVAEVIARGAAGAVVEQSFWGAASGALRASLLAVSDTTAALQRLAHSVRVKWGKTVVAITGSTGKSTTKEMAAAILARRLRVLKSQGNLNNHYGLPLTLLGLEPAHEAVVAELAMSAAGEIALLARIAEPQVGVVTNVAPVHLQFFDSVDAIARAKKELIDHLPAGATAVLNHDDWRVRDFAQGFSGRALTFGFEPGADFRAVECRLDGSRGSVFRVEGPALAGEYRLPLPGRHDVQNALAALAAASVFEVSATEAQQALATLPPLAQRSEILTLSNGAVLINDCYNSNPLAMEKMLETLANWPDARRRLVVAGEMLELGATSPDLHRAVGRKCQEAGVDWLMAVQGDAQFMAEGAQQAGLPPERARFFATLEEAAECCRTLLQPGDVVLVKGSRGVHLERAVELLQAAFPGTVGRGASEPSD
ncbi:MAG: UDP-N-acetylmuramoyl-tripeptide--D-alanyl-D-alanine ligase [Terriglobia bacterium]|jgi:UDP-N-acetylmuramoyl-tripeptide--D-alanyl-D-alanine ligase